MPDAQRGTMRTVRGSCERSLSRLLKWTETDAAGASIPLSGCADTQAGNRASAALPCSGMT
jgi:hypothetical protein